LKVDGLFQSFGVACGRHHLEPRPVPPLPPRFNTWAAKVLGHCLSICFWPCCPCVCRKTCAQRSSKLGT
jgi:hypothetical protein